ncbi:MAG: Gfo/Idh/MocA family oxidoreductase [Acidimicrobiia bacterium]
MTEPLRLAVVGVGRMGALHAETLAAADSIDVVAVADSISDVAGRVADQIGADGYESLDALSKRDDVEAWLIATPTTTHPSVVEMALEAGLHILCEKPLALDLAESERLGAQAAADGLVLQVGFWRRFAPPWVAARRAIVDGAIGRPLMLRLAQWDADPPPASFCDPLTSGGLAIDCGVHEFDLVGWMTGLGIETVTGRNLPLVDQSIGDVGDVDNLLAVLDLEGGAAATVDLSRNCRFGDDVRTEILGEDGAIFVDLLPVGRTRLADASGIRVLAGSETNDAFVEGIKAQAQAFVEAVRGAPIDVPGAADSTLAVAVGRAVQRSAAEGVPVTLTGLHSAG